MKQLLVILVALSAAAAVGADTSTVRGRIIFSGKPPAPETVRIGGDDYCERVNGDEAVTGQEVVVNSNSTLKNVVVWIDEGWADGKLPETTATEAITLTLHKCMPTSHVVALQTGQPLKVVNADETVHNINARSNANGNFNYNLRPGGEPVTLKFDNPEVAINLRSAIHPWITAYVAVFEHPAFDITGSDGTFELPSLPVGEYRLAAWHEKFGMATVDVLVQRDVVAEVDFNFTETGAKSGVQANEFATARPSVDEETTSGSESK